MSRRYVKTAKINDLGEISPKIVSVVSTKNNIQNEATQQTYFKRNYLEAIRKIVPQLYFSDEQAVSGSHISFPNQLINSHIIANKNQSTILPVSALVDDNYLSAIDNPSGFARFFYKQNTPATIAPDDFERNILFPLDKKFSDFKASASFINFISGTFLPSIPLVAVGHHATDNLATLTTSSYANDSSGTYKYLANTLGWVYFLNRSGPAGGFDSSTAVATLLTETLWKGRSIVLEDCMKVYEEYLWRNQSTWGLTDKIIPVDYVSSVSMSGVTYASGTQLLDRLKTLNNIVYSPHYLDSPDTKVEEAFTTYLTTSSLLQDGALITETQEAGPLARFLEAMSFSIADSLTEQNEIGVLYDIGKCPDEFLDLLAELIGWRFIGADLDKWRVQLRNAVKIYKMKGTRRSIQFLLDTLFSTGVFDVNTSNTLLELWEPYIPNILYYSLATSSPLFTNYETYSEASAARFGVPSYTKFSMETNIKYVVDKILFDLFLEFPENFRLGAAPFPKTRLYNFVEVKEKWLPYGKEYAGPYHIMHKGKYPSNYELPNFKKNKLHAPPASVSAVYMTGLEHTQDSKYLALALDDPDFIFEYRNKINLIPPYEKRQYYMNTQVTHAMVERIKYYLTCFGVDANFAIAVTDYLKENITESIDTDQAINNFLLFTKQKTYPPNYGNIIKDVTKERIIDPVSLLSLWNGKSSHFLIRFDSSSFNWASNQLRSTGKYGIQKVKSALDQVIPAHAIPEMIVSLSALTDAMDAIADNDCREWRPNFNDLYEGSSTVTTNWGTCAVDMEYVGLANGLTPKRFKRIDVDNIHDPLLASGLISDGNNFIAVRRNSLRRRNYHNLLPETKMFTRLGKNNPGSLELSTSYYSSSVGFLPLGFIPSSLTFQEIPLVTPPDAFIEKVIDHSNMPDVWHDCQNLSSPSSIFGYDISNTFASRAKQVVATSDCNTYGRRGQLPEIMNTMHRVFDQEKYLQASSIVSGYLDTKGKINPNWPVSSTLITPSEFKYWYYNAALFGEGNMDVVKSIANHLINSTSSDESLNYFEHFKFGYAVQRFYSVFNNLYGGHGTQNNYDLMGVPNLFSHTYGPLIYNSNLDVDGSAIDTSGYLAASAPLYEVNIAYYGGSGVLSVSGMKGLYTDVGTYAASDTSNAYLSKPEFRNNNLVSAIELVDSSVAPTINNLLPHPTFSIFNLARANETTYSFSKYLVNNQIIKYHRAATNDRLPRLRIKIDNSDSSNKARNFLEPDHIYEVTVDAHNMPVVGNTLGNQDLCFWIHTEPEDGKVWYYVPRGLYDPCTKLASEDQWVQVSVDDLATGGINIAQNRSLKQRFVYDFKLNDPKGYGETGNKPLPPTKIYDKHCWKPYLLEEIIPGSNPLAILNISERTRKQLKFKFSTMNNTRLMRILNNLKDNYYADYGNVHRADQKYVLEFFVREGDSNKFVVFESISLQDLTNYDKSIIQTRYGDVRLDSKDLKAVFRYFKDLHGGINSRNATVTSGTMEVSGGSRLNYRSNVGMYPFEQDPTYAAYTEITIHEG